jgi:O-antigen ligase
MRVVRERIGVLDLNQAALLAGGIGAAAVLARSIASTGKPSMPAVGLVTLAAAVLVLSLQPHVLFLGWFALAPLFQESASYTSVGHPLNLALYFAPSVVFAIWTLTHRPLRRPRFVDYLPLAFLLYVLATLVVAGDVTSTLVKGVYITIGIGIVLYYFFALGPVGSLRKETVVGGLLVVSILESVMSIADGLTGWNLWHDTAWQVGGDHRAVATLANPAVLGTLIGMGVVFAVAILVWGATPRLRMLSVAVVGLGAPALYFTLTRGPVIATVIASVLILGTRAGTRILAVAALIVALGVLVGSWGKITSSAVYKHRVTNADNVQVRLALEQWSFKLAEQKPVFGWGYNAFDEAKQVAGFTAQDLQRFGTSSTSHNSYLTILVDYGISGILLLLVPWVVIGGRAVLDFVAGEEPRWFLLGSVAALVVYVLANNAGDFKYFSFVPAVAWVVLGLLRRDQLAAD